MVLHLSLNQLLLALPHISIVWHVLDVVVANMVHLTEHPSVLPGEKHVLHVVVQIIFARVCRSSYTQQSQAGVRSLDSLPLDDIDSAQMDAMIAHVTFDQHNGHYTATTVTDNAEEINAVVIPFSPEPDPRLPDNIPSVSESVVRIFPDSGATICLGGLSHLNDMGFSTDNSRDRPFSSAAFTASSFAGFRPCSTLSVSTTPWVVVGFSPLWNSPCQE